MSEAPVPPPSSSGPSSGPTAHATTMVRNIVVSVISTVLGATMIYFLGFHNKGGGGGGSSAADMLVTKESTTKAWKSYVAVENIYYKNTQSIVNELQRTQNFSDFRENVNKESQKFQEDLPQVIKDKTIDGAFVSMINRRLENEKGSEIKMKGYFDNIQSILRKDLTTAERRRELDDEDAAWEKYNLGMRERAVIDVEDLAKMLSERYQQPFAVNDLLIYVELKKGLTDPNKTSEKKDNTQTQLENKTDANKPVDQNDPQGVGPAEPSNEQKTVDNNDKNATNANLNNKKTEEPKNNSGNYNQKMLGEWYTADAEIGIFKNGSMYWNLQSGESTSGTWRWDHNQLFMYPQPNRSIKKGTIWVFTISDLSAHTLTLTMATQPFYKYFLSKD